MCHKASSIIRARSALSRCKHIPEDGPPFGKKAAFDIDCDICRLEFRSCITGTFRSRSLIPVCRRVETFPMQTGSDSSTKRPFGTVARIRSTFRFLRCYGGYISLTAESSRGLVQRLFHEIVIDVSIQEPLILNSRGDSGGGRGRHRRTLFQNVIGGRRNVEWHSRCRRSRDASTYSAIFVSLPRLRLPYSRTPGSDEPWTTRTRGVSLERQAERPGSNEDLGLEDEDGECKGRSSASLKVRIRSREKRDRME